MTELFGENVFNDSQMRARLPKAVYKTLKKVMAEGGELDKASADVIANAMKDWAIEKGATHFCHWFQPMTGSTAEKHDSFIDPTPDGKVIMEFSGKALIQGEPDASSFPSGGLRATFEARGYTAWDCTSPAFIKGDGANTTLFIPCAFCSYTGEALDKKTPLLRSMDAIDKAAVRVLKALGCNSTRVTGTLGGEQEYFLIDKKFVEQRQDLYLAGRTLFGAPSPKGQEMDDHYFGSINERVASFMAELNQTLWKLGVSATTQHNEVAPAQYELAPVFATVNVATDANQLTMEIMQKVALRHDFVCLLNEKPFAGLNGSGKHNNWSLVTDDGINLFDPGETPHENMVFLTFLLCTIRAVHKYSKLLRASVATPGNDHRLGANEAPPAIVSVFLGDQLGDIYDQLAKGGAKKSKKAGALKLGVSTLPPLPKDNTDRNRTSPFAFTGNKFEFRMVGSTQSLSGPNFVLNTIVAEICCELADTLEKCKDEKAVQAALQKTLSAWAKEHAPVIFNGDNYADAWVKEAAKRGLPNIPNSPDSLATICDKENVEVLKKHKVLSKGELVSRTEILFEQYGMVLNIEGQTMISMAKRQILPAAIAYAGNLATTVSATQDAGVESPAQVQLLKELCEQIDALKTGIEKLEKAVAKAAGVSNPEKRAFSCRDDIKPAMAEVREAADALEMMVDAEMWPIPTYAEMLFLR